MVTPTRRVIRLEGNIGGPIVVDSAETRNSLEGMYP
jgi:hypothetical protein